MESTTHQIAATPGGRLEGIPASGLPSATICVLMLVCHTIVSAQSASAPPSRQNEVLVRDIVRLAKKIEYKVKDTEEEIKALHTRKNSLHWILELLKNIENNPAEYDNGKELYRIGAMFEDGSADMNLEPDPYEAMVWYRKAAIIHNHVQSQHTLGMLYLLGHEGRGDYVSQVQPNLAEAAMWFKKAAEQGDTESQFNLAVLLATGQGVRKDEDEAEKWLEKAEQGGLKKTRAYFEEAKQDVEDMVRLRSTHP